MINLADFGALILDMDGVFIDSEPRYFKAFNIILRPLGITLTEDYFSRMVGLSAAKNLQDISHDFGIALDVEDFADQMNKTYIDLLRDKDLEVQPGIWTLISKAKFEGMPLGLCTSSSDRIVEQVLENVQLNVSLDRLFDAVVTGSEVEHRKPHPEPYLRIAGLLGRPPSRCLAIEDSASGIASAKAAGCTCVGLTAPYNRQQDFSRADEIISEVIDLVTY